MSCVHSSITGRVKLGIAGCGVITQRGLLPHLCQEDARARCELRALMDPAPGRAEACAAKFRVPQHFTDYAQMLASDIDALVLASPTGLHFEQAMEAIARGKHLHINKAMTTTKAEADQLIAAAEQAGVVLVASPGRAHAPDIRRIKQLLDEEEIGRVYFATLGMAGIGHEFERLRHGQDPVSDIDPAWYYKRPGGGPMYDMAIYSLHAITALLGPARRVAAMSGRGSARRSFKGAEVEVEVDDNTHLLLDFGDSVFCSLFGTNSHGAPLGRGGLYISGSEGAISCSAEQITVESPYLPGGRRVEPRPQALPHVQGVHERIPEAHVYSDLMHMVECVREQRAPALDAAHARHVIEIIELGYRAARRGETSSLETSFELGSRRETWA